MFFHDISSFTFLTKCNFKITPTPVKGKEAKYILGHDSLKSHSTYETKGN